MHVSFPKLSEQHSHQSLPPYPYRQNKFTFVVFVEGYNLLIDVE